MKWGRIRECIPFCTTICGSVGPWATSPFLFHIVYCIHTFHFWYYISLTSKRCKFCWCLVLIWMFPGAKRLIMHLHKHGIPFGLATSSSVESYNLKVTKHHLELFSLFPYKTFGSSDPEVKRGKPHPDIFLVAASKFPEKPKPDQVCVSLYHFPPNNCLKEFSF